MPKLLSHPDNVCPLNNEASPGSGCSITKSGRKKARTLAPFPPGFSEDLFSSLCPFPRKDSTEKANRAEGSSGQEAGRREINHCH